MKKFAHEHRKQERFFKRCIVEFSADGQTYRGISINLCLGGLFIKTRKSLPVDKIINIIVDLPESTAKLAGKVKRSIREPHSRTLEIAGIPSKDGMGVELIEKDTHYVEFIRSLAGRETIG